MNKFSVSTLAGKLFLVSALVILFTVGVIGLSGYWLAEKSIADEVQRRVSCVRSERQDRVELWFEEMYRSLNYFTNGSNISNIVRDELLPDNEKRIILDKHLSNYMEYYDTIASFVLARLDGSIISSWGNPHGENNISNLPAFMEAVTSNYAIGPIHINAEGETVFNIALPVTHEGLSIAMIVCEMYSSRTIEPILMDSSGLGRSGESFLIGFDTLMLTPSRFYNHPEPLTHKMPIPNALLALQGKKGVSVYQSFLGMEVVGAYARLEKTGWALITEMVTDEAFAPLDDVARNTVIVSGLALIMMLFLSVILSRNWTKPMENLANASLKVAEGDLAVRMSVDNRIDEIGTLTRQFNHMVGAIAESRMELGRSHNRLIQAEKMAAIGELVTGIVHEMRNPLSVIKMNINLIQRRPDHSPEKDPVMAEQLELASTEAKQLEKMLSELLDYSKPISLDRKNQSMREIVDKSLRSVEQFALRKEIEIKYNSGDNNDFQVYADENTLSVILVNLVLNAIQASERNSHIDLFCTLRNDNLKIQVSDNGTGMSTKIQARILDPFFTTRETGTGLGLSNVKKIVDLYGGSIQIESEEKVGTKFKIELSNMVKHG